MTLVAVSKTVPADRITAAIAAGLTIFGENRVQEGEAKRPHVAGAGRVVRATWHLIGPLQSNKARRAIEVFETIQSVDSVDLARRLDRVVGEGSEAAAAGSSAAPAAGPRLPLAIYLQVNVDHDAAKVGFHAADLEAALPELADLPNLRLMGLMTVGRLVGEPEEARPTFVRLRTLSERLRDTVPGLGSGLSMGMSGDFEVAVEEGATVVRVGRAIFGERQVALAGR